MKAKIIASIVGLLLAHNLSAQQQSKDTPPPIYLSASGASGTFVNAPGSGTLTFDYSFTSGITSPSITVQGCGQSGNCSTLTPTIGTNPYTSTTGSQVQFAGGYFLYKVTATFSGTGTITVSLNGIQAKAGGGGSGGATTFDQIGSGTNTTHGLVVGDGSVLTTSGTGVNNANELGGVLLSGLPTGALCNTTGTGAATVCGATASAGTTSQGVRYSGTATLGPSSCQTDTNTAYGILCPTTFTNAAGPHWQSDATATPASVMDQVTSTNSGLTSGLPAAAVCTIGQAFSTGTSYTGFAICNQAGVQGVNFYASPAHALNGPVWVRALSCVSTGCSTNTFTATTPYVSSVGTAVASAATIAPSTAIFHVTGTAAISTMTPPTGFSSTTGGTLTLIADAAWTLVAGTTTGQFKSAMTAVAGTPYSCTYDGTLFFCK